MIGHDYSTHVHTRETRPTTMKQSLFPEVGHLIQTADTQIPAIRHKRPTFRSLLSSLINRTSGERGKMAKLDESCGGRARDIIVDAEGWSCEKYIGVCRGDWSRGDERRTGHEKALAYQRGGYAISMEPSIYTPSNRDVSTHLAV